MTPGGSLRARDLFLGQFDEPLPVFAFEHNDHAGDGLAIAKRGAFGGRGADVDVGHIAQEQRDAILRAQDDIAEVAWGGRAAASE